MGFHCRRIWGVFLFNFFPLSVGFGPTPSWARGAFTDEESALCHSQETHSISSSSAIPFFQSFEKNPASRHSRKYLWRALGLPNRSLGTAFHCTPVRRTYTIQEKTIFGSIGFRHPHDWRTYVFEASLFLCGMRGRAFAHNWSDTSQDWILDIWRKKSKMLTHSTLFLDKCNIIYG